VVVVVLLPQSPFEVQPLDCGFESQHTSVRPPSP
jgi:hypothetical protein